MKIPKNISPVTGSTDTEVNPSEQVHAAAPSKRLKTRQKLPLVSMLADPKAWFPPMPPEGFEFADFYHL